MKPIIQILAVGMLLLVSVRGDDFTRIEKEFAHELSKIAESRFEKYEALQKAYTSRGDLDGALAIRDRQAKIAAQLKALALGQVPSAMHFDCIAGKWNGAWGTSGGRLTVTVNQDGKLTGTKSGKIIVADGRFIFTDNTDGTTWELIPNPAANRIVLAGWSKSRNAAKEQPNHIALLMPGD